ncbi:adenylate kinase [Saccharicrinis fermentans]|uniref:Adenylate kinase n=1 Tax=Saccharicrinis fermentans DSM 9555 = JCM 21142 TaxID=869213 RepID=W7YKM7_9BACT|nr:adenylate kinase [Saccharicrinis fermentans]GAF02919.1 adenylate kinase [Saccharicrinis fermentans DSM 9555 = JCM 21142]
MLNVVIFGPPGSGKGTQSENIIKKYNLAHISTGDLLRAEISGHTQLGTIAKSFIDKGELVPDETIIGMIDNKIESLANTNGVIFDGFPRTEAQAAALDQLLAEYKTGVSVMVNLEVPKEELIERLLKRGETSGRSDDNLETIEKRISVYETQTKPVIDFYKKKKVYQSIQGVGSVEEIFESISAAIDSAK